MTGLDLVAFGTGSLARSLVLSLAGLKPQPLRIVLAGRNTNALSNIALLAQARAAAFEGSFTVQVCQCDYSERELERLFLRYRPKIVMVLASRQSPWTMENRWKKLLTQVGYGFTLPLQASIASRVLGMAQATLPKPILLNACYPDVVNRLLYVRGLRVSGGIGNVAIISAALRGLHQDSHIRVIAHHSHVSALIKGRWDGLRLPLIWSDEVRWTQEEVSALVHTLRLPADDTLNSVTGASAIPMLMALAGHSEAWNGHSPGVNGLLGGYPVQADTSGLAISLPSEVTLDKAIEFNYECGAFDGVLAEDDGTFRLAIDACEIERSLGMRIPEELVRWHASDLDEVADRLDVFRRKLEYLELRQAPPS